MSGSRDRDRHIDSTGPVDNEEEEEEEEEEANEASEEQDSISSNPQLGGDDTESSDDYTKSSTSASNSRKCSNKDKMGGERALYLLSTAAQYVSGSIPKARSTYKKLIEPIQLQFVFEQILRYPDDMFFAIPNDIAEAHFPSLTFRESGDLYRFENLGFLDVQPSELPRMIWPIEFVRLYSIDTYVFMKGWKEFVTAHKWKEGDAIHFYKSAEPYSYEFYYISCVKAIELYGFTLNQWFQKKLTKSDDLINALQIPPAKGEKHFRSLKYPDGAGYYKKEKLLVSDPENTGWPMEIRFLPGYDNYIIFGDWSWFVATHKLKPPDVIRLFKVVKNAAHKNHYMIDYVRANKAATSETSPVGPGKEGKHNGVGSSQKHGDIDKS
ncbi:hypothetical protein Acr_15g0006840 [Actinidia rufa]|uniref:TF-B3 domain-containing protein n=1 Tax=Actinidia rufa TaxID=165716 RepID=A0A7J0FTP1_9ERIC|nr:hypothetical protein Acr_15g0006840 [Actinidia rufa]